MKTTRNGYNYFVEDGKFSIDGYDFFDTLEALEDDIDWQVLWIDGKAYRDENGEWRRSYEIGENKLLSILDELFGNVGSLTDEEFNFRAALLGERESHLIADRYLTQDEILEIEERWSLVRAA